jgi:hypothetical protein
MARQKFLISGWPSWPSNRSRRKGRHKGRALALSGEAAKARIAYQDFFTLWKDADPDIPILRAAKSE